MASERPDAAVIPPARVAEHAAMLANRLGKRARHLRKWARREGISCYRLYDRDIPEVPLAIDWYDGDLVVALWAGKHGGRDLAWTRAMADAAGRALALPPERIHIKERRRHGEGEQYQRARGPSARKVALEGGLRFRVDLDAYVDTGLFLDHRPTRLRVGAEAAGKRFLNLFCYTGAFTVHAAAGGASASTSVDLSNTYLDWARDNLALNGLEGPEHVLVRADVRTWLAAARTRPVRYQLAVVDPPTFSRSKAAADFDVRRDHGALLTEVQAVMAPGGVVYFSTNSRRFELDRAALERATPGATIEDITEDSIGPDFRDRAIHRCFRITAPEGP